MFIKQVNTYSGPYDNYDMRVQWTLPPTNTNGRILHYLHALKPGKQIHTMVLL